MPEGMNIEAAHKLTEKPEAPQTRDRRTWSEIAEILEVIVLAAVAIATAWSGYQAARWDGRQAFLYGTASRERIEADEATTLGGQQKLLDVSTFNTWIQARQSGNEQLAALYVRRFSPEYKVAFDAWLKTDPFHDPTAPPGPSFMPEYVNPGDVAGQKLNDQASSTFTEGTEARETADRLRSPDRPAGHGALPRGDRPTIQVPGRPHGCRRHRAGAPDLRRLGDRHASTDLSPLKGRDVHRQHLTMHRCVRPGTHERRAQQRDRSVTGLRLRDRPR